MRAARHLAQSDPHAAAGLLVRFLLLWRGELDEEAADEAWLEAAAERVGE